MTDRISTSLFWLYIAGWLADWSYWIATGRLDPDSPVISGVVAGFFLAWAWPLHAAAELWRWVLM